jgi:hypothetical protein
MTLLDTLSVGLRLFHMSFGKSRKVHPKCNFCDSASSLGSIFTYCRYKFLIANLRRLQILHCIGYKASNKMVR